MDAAERGLIKLGAACFVLILLCAALGLALSAQSAANRANTSVRGSCQFWRDLSQLPLAANSTKVAFTIIADSRIAYARQACPNHLGDLPKPDPRVVPFLPLELR